MRKPLKAHDSSPPRRGAVVVTGASTGIGRAIVELLSREQFIVFATVRNEVDRTALETLAAVRGVIVDVTDHASIAKAAQEVDASGIPLRGLVNNAGIAIGGPLEHVAPAKFRHQLEVNVVGSLAVTQAFLPHLRAAHGRVIFVGSVAGRISMPFIGPYSASKFALRALADALRIELGHAGVRVSLIEPGSVRTPIWRKGRATREEIEQRLGPVGTRHYGDIMLGVMRQTQTEERVGMPPERVAQIIYRALTTKRPRAHYIVGAPARIGTLLSLLPAPVHDRIMRATMRLPKPRSPSQRVEDR